MRKFRGFNLKKRVIKIFRLNHSFSGYRRLDLDPPSKSISKLFSRLKTKAKTLCSNPGRVKHPDYAPLGHDPIGEKTVTVPKGHLAVYVGQKDGDFHRFLVPVIYFNHPRFGELLRESEEEFGFDHPGGITIPCRISDFQSVQTQIAARGRGCRKLLTWKRSSRV